MSIAFSIKRVIRPNSPHRRWFIEPPGVINIALAKNVINIALAKKKRPR
jgi:hypothetical protein